MAAAEADPQGFSDKAAARPRRKKAKSAYQLFQEEVLPKYFKENPSVRKSDMGARAKAMSSAWKALPEEETRRFRDMAASMKPHGRRIPTARWM